MSYNGYRFRGFPMVATEPDSGGGRRIHLARTLAGPRGVRAPAGTLCGLGQSKVVDMQVATGWPDCAACLKRSTALERRQA